jgi:hypothetical protein
MGWCTSMEHGHPSHAHIDSTPDCHLHTHWVKLKPKFHPNLTSIQTNKHHIHTIVCVCECKWVLLIIADDRIWFNPMWYLYNAGGRVVVPNRECFSSCSWYLWQEVLKASPPVLHMWLQTVKFIVKKSKCAGFSAPNSCSFPWLVKGAS